MVDAFSGFFPKLNPTPFFPLWISLFFSDNKGIPFVIVVCFCGLMWGKKEKYFAWGIWIGDLIAKRMRQSSNRFFVNTKCDTGVVVSPTHLGFPLLSWSNCVRKTLCFFSLERSTFSWMHNYLGISIILTVGVWDGGKGVFPSSSFENRQRWLGRIRRDEKL